MSKNACPQVQLPHVSIQLVSRQIQQLRFGTQHTAMVVVTSLADISRFRDVSICLKSCKILVTKCPYTNFVCFI